MLKHSGLTNALLATAAVFSAEQENIAVYAGVNESGFYYYEGTTQDTTGFELELFGSITDNIKCKLRLYFLRYKR